MTMLSTIMSTDVKTVAPETTLRELAEFLVEEGVGGAPVLASGRVVGVVSATDLLEFDSEDRGVPAYRPAGDADPLAAEDEWTEAEGNGAAAYFADLWVDAGAQLATRLSTDGPEWNALEDHDVSEIMTTRVLSLPPGAEVREAAGRMTEAGVHRLLVIDEDRLVGVVTATDIVRAVARHGLGDRS